MEYKTQTLQELKEKSPLAPNKKALVGIDGFVDVIVRPVDQRSGPGDQFNAIPTITDFANRIGSAAGKSANIEMAPIVEKLGGNGPIMANAQSAHGIEVRYIGAIRPMPSPLQIPASPTLPNLMMERSCLELWQASTRSPIITSANYPAKTH
jgi:hypothetical protein